MTSGLRSRLRRAVVALLSRRATRSVGVPAMLCVLVLAAASCTQSSGTPDADESASPRTTAPTTKEPPPPPPPPASQECRRLDYGEIRLYSNDDKTVPCKSPHTAFTFAVEELPDSAVVDGVAIGNESIQNAADAICHREYVDYIGGDDASRTLSRLTVTYFVPDQQAFDLGASWVRCDVVALQAERVLAPLPDDLGGFLNDEDALGEYGVCSRGEPGAASSKLLMCTQPHDYRAIEALRLGKTADDYPGEEVTRDEGQGRCEDLVAEEYGVGAGYTFSWTYPTPADWEAGQRFGLCWRQDTG